MTARIVVTGSTGFVGRALLPLLVRQGHDVEVLDRADSSAPPSQVVDRVGRLQPDVVIHLATHFLSTHVADDIPALVRSNVEWGTVVAEAATAAGARLVTVGSAWQHYDGAAYDPVSLYAATKQALDVIVAYYVRVRGLDAVSATLFDTYGPGDERPKLVPLLMQSALSGQALQMSDGGQLIDLTFVDDVAAGLAGLATQEHPPPEAVLRSGEPVSIRTLVGTVEAVTGRPVEVEWDVRPARPREMRTDWVFGSRPEGWVPTVSLADGLARTWRAYRERTTTP